MKWLVLGANGMLGIDLTEVLAGQDVTSLKKSDCDITKPAEVENCLAGFDVVINCAAYTKVDDAESNQQLAKSINGTGAKNLAIASSKFGSKLVQISTDYVFPGDAKSPYDENAQTGPKSIYGESKLIGELAVKQYLPDSHYLVRTAWLYGKNGPSFPKAILALAAKQDVLKVVDDQIGQPTWTMDLAHKIYEIVINELPAGTYHATSAGQVSWFGYAQELFRLNGFDPQRIKPVSSAEFIRPAPRPAYSVLSHANLIRFGLTPMRNWKSGLQDAVEQGIFNG